jgi:hypothetical protein
VELATGDVELFVVNHVEGTVARLREVVATAKKDQAV